jgi:hypothetical protein
MPHAQEYPQPTAQMMKATLNTFLPRIADFIFMLL